MYLFQIINILNVNVLKNLYCIFRFYSRGMQMMQKGKQVMKKRMGSKQ